MKRSKSYLVYFKDHLFCDRLFFPLAAVTVNVPTSRLSQLCTGNLIYTQVPHFKDNISRYQKLCFPDFWLTKRQWHLMVTWMSNTWISENRLTRRLSLSRHWCSPQQQHFSFWSCKWSLQNNHNKTLFGLPLTKVWALSCMSHWDI